MTSFQTDKNLKRSWIFDNAEEYGREDNWDFPHFIPAWQYDKTSK